MSFLTYLHNFIVSNFLTVYYNAQVLLLFAINYVKNPFGDPFALKLRLEPPPPLTDPKYGVHKYIKVNNIKLHYIESGDPSKPLMLFIHGFPEFWYSWRHQIVDFNKDYWCIAVDMRGFADSERLEGLEHYKIEVLIEDVRDLIKQLGRQKAILISHDWGGLIAVEFRRAYPEHVQSLVMLGSTSKEAWTRLLWNDDEQRKLSWYVFFYRMPSIPEKLMQMDNVNVFNKAMSVSGKDTINEQDIECFKYWFGKLDSFTPPINYYRANFKYVTPPKPKCEEKIPFLFVLSKNDPYLSEKNCDEIKKDFECIETCLVDGCGHFMQQEEPVKINKLIREFLVKHKL